MDLSTRPATLNDIAIWRESYRREMNCQIVHDALHARPGWTRSHVLVVDGVAVGYGALAVGGPWAGQPAVFEFYIVPRIRNRLFDLFQALLEADPAPRIEAQSNDELLTTMLHTYARNVASERILFADHFTTSLSAQGADFTPVTAADVPILTKLEMDPAADHVLRMNGEIVAAGGILHHYNPPYGDLFMTVAEPYRRRGLGAFLVQELKRVCREGNRIPAARCRTNNVASRRTLQKAGFVPCGHILTGDLVQS